MMPCAIASPDQEQRELLIRMTNDTFKDIEKLETDLWKAADDRHVVGATDNLTRGDE